MSSHLRICWILIYFVAVCSGARATAAQERFLAPQGCVVERIAAEPLVRYPMFACFDDRGRLYVAEGSGRNVPGTELEQTLPCKITLLEDQDGDGKFDRSTTYADKLIFPAGVLWHDGRVYVASPPGILRFEDTDGDGRADRRDVLVSGFRHDGTGHDVHGPFWGIDGWLYWTDGLRDYDVLTREGKRLQGRAALIWRCRPDGRNIEWLCGGGIDNPVELLFLPDGTLVGTMDQTPGDAILHYVDGGWYPSLHDDRVTELPYTGPQLGSITQFSAALPAALCGFCRIETDYFGPQHKGTLITTQFNVHRLQQHVLSRDRSTYSSTTSDFLLSTDYDVRPTDVLEDADGSLIWVDMGAWYNYECPTAKIAKPDAFGSIYRIRRRDKKPTEDPWGLSIQWESQTAAALLGLLEDSRAKVRSKALAALVRLGARAVVTLARALRDQETPADLRGRVVSVLTQIGTPDARQVVRAALGDPAAEVRQLAAHCVGVERDRDAFAPLVQLVASDTPAVRLEAAEALGQLGQTEAIAGLQASLATCGGDRFLEHALIFALIRIGAAKQTTALLADPHPDVRRAGLIALDQMPEGQLTRESVTRLLNTEDPDLKQAALRIVSRRPGWSEEILAYISTTLESPRLSDDDRETLTGALLVHANNRRVQRLVSDAIGEPATAPRTRRLLVEFIGQCPLQEIPSEWSRALHQTLTADDVALQRTALAAVERRRSADFSEVLLSLSRQKDTPDDNRLIAMSCLAAELKPLPEWAFEFLAQQLGGRTEPLTRMSAARALGSAHCSDEQLLRLAEMISVQGPLAVPALLPAFQRSSSRESGLALVEALRTSPGAAAVTIDDLDALLRRYPAAVRQAAQPLRLQRAQALKEQEAYLAGLTSQLLSHPGDAERGRRVFFAKRVGCYSCHRIAGEGGHVGPDLSFIGKFRRTVDLLEAIAVPSSTIVPGYRSYAVVTKDGRVHTGLIVRQTADTVFLRTPQLAEMRISRGEIEAVNPSPNSAMPTGLINTMTPQEFSDLMEFLYRLR